MKSVLISIQQKWCELIASGKKIVEVRKTRPKLETPFKVYIYQTIDGGAKYDRIVSSGLICGKVIGEFVCDKIVKFENSWYEPAFGETSYFSCVGCDELEKYLGTNEYGYGWHISDLVIYDKPRELSEFYQKGKNNDQYYYDYCSGCEHHETPIGEYPCNECDGNRNYLYRPPQSWCYVESENAE